MKWVHDLAALMNPDAYARAWYDRDDKKWKYAKVEEPVTAELIDKHLSNEQPVGLYTLSSPKEKDASGHVVIFDLDNHDGALPDDFMQAVAARICEGLEDRDYAYEVVRSGGGNGYHVWVVFENAKRVDQLRKFAKDVLDWLSKDGVRHPTRREENSGKLAPLKIAEGTNGLQNGQIEIFPKGSGWNLVALPCARKSVRLRRDGSKLVEASNDALAVNKNKKSGPKAKATDKDAAFDAIVLNGKLKKNKNSDDLVPIDVCNYDHWVAIGHMLIAAFGKDDPWAFDRWCAWAMTMPDAPPREQQEAKWRDDLESDPSYSKNTFWLCARDAGYTGKMPFTKSDERKFGLLDMITKLEIVCSPDEETYACIGPRNYEPVRSRAFKAFVRRKAFSENGELLKAEDLHAAIETVDAMALDGAVCDVHLRFAAHGEKRYFFLADDDCTTIEIDAQGWRTCEQPPVRFRRGDGRALLMPQDGTLSHFSELVNVDDDNLPFLLAWIVSCILRPGLVSPIALLTGVAGAAKSSALQTVVDTLDPKAGAKAGMPKSEDDLFVAAHHGAIVSFDNVSTLAILADALCRLATGGGLRKRTLHTTIDVTAIDVIRPVILSGIDPPAYNQDLIERLVPIELYPVKKRIDDETFARMAAQARPKLLGLVLSLASRVLAMGDFEVEDTRMLGYAKIGEAITRILGRKPGCFGEMYRSVLEINAKEAADADCVFQSIRKLVANLDTGRNKYSATAQELLEHLHDAVNKGYLIAAREDIPKNARAMGCRIKRILEALRKVGIEATQSKRDRSWTIERLVASEEEVFNTSMRTM